MLQSRGITIIFLSFFILVWIVRIGVDAIRSAELNVWPIFLIGRLCGFIFHLIIMANTEHTLSMDTINPNIIKLQYAVRGPIVARAAELEKEVDCGSKKKFDQVVKCNIGDCHATGQKPMTYLRQVIALCSYPELLKDSSFPEDVKARAKKILTACGGQSVGKRSSFLLNTK